MSDTFTNDKINGKPNMSESPGLGDMGGGGDSQHRPPEMQAAKQKGNYVSSVIEKFFVGSTFADRARAEPRFPRAYSGSAHNTSGSAADAGTPSIVCLCTNPENCVTLKNVLELYRSAISEEQAWALIFQFVSVYQRMAKSSKFHVFGDSEIPDNLENVNVHRDGSVHCSQSLAQHQETDPNLPQPADIGQGDGKRALVAASHRKVLRNLGFVVYNALDYDLPADEEYTLSKKLEGLFDYMTAEEEDDNDFDFVLQTCRDHIKPTDCVPEYHYKSVCRALAAAPIQLRSFVKMIVKSGAGNLYLRAAPDNARPDVLMPGFTEWARLWMQVVQEFRGGVSLKKSNFVRTPIEFELTPYEALMENIRSRSCKLRAVMVNGEVPPPQRQKSAHTLLMESIRARPPLKKTFASQVPSLRATPTIASV